MRFPRQPSLAGGARREFRRRDMRAGGHLGGDLAVPGDRGLDSREPPLLLRPASVRAQGVDANLVAVARASLDAGHVVRSSRHGRALHLKEKGEPSRRGRHAEGIPQTNVSICVNGRFPGPLPCSRKPPLTCGSGGI